MPGVGNSGQPRQSLPALPTSEDWAGISPALETVPAQSGSDTWRVIAISSNGSTQQVTGTLVVGTDKTLTINGAGAANFVHEIKGQIERFKIPSKERAAK